MCVSVNVTVEKQVCKYGSLCVCRKGDCMGVRSRSIFVCVTMQTYECISVIVSVQE